MFAFRSTILLLVDFGTIQQCGICFQFIHIAMFDVRYLWYITYLRNHWVVTTSSGQ